MAKHTIRIGTRGSQLALYQAELTKKNLLEKFPDINVEIVVIQTKGDKILDVALSKIGDKAKGMAIGMAIINKIDSAKWDISRSSHSLLFQSIAQGNTVRENWIYTYEKIEVVKKFIQAKANNVPAYYAPGYADRLLLITNEHGKTEFGFEPLWDSENREIVRLSEKEIIPMIEMANRLMKEEPEIYKPYRSKAFLSDNLKRELSKEFKMGEATAYERMKKFTKKVNDS
jgi:hypothetical protein